MVLQGLSGRKAENLKEVDLGWINGGRKDRGFGWGKMRDVGELTPGGVDSACHPSEVGEMSTSVWV